MRVLLLSAYAAQSHVQWQNNLQLMFPHWQWQVLSLPPRHFSWRVRGNPLYWSIDKRAELEAGYDLLIATSMVDLATLRGLVPALAALPSVLYFHENQFEYPQGRQRHSLLEAQMVSLYSALAANRVLFNSAFNRDSFLQGCQALLSKLPDKVPAGVVEALANKTQVLPVPLDFTGLTRDEGEALPQHAWPGTAGSFPARPLRLLWLGRFEHDKGGDRLLLLLRRLESLELAWELAVVGQQFRDSPPAFDRIDEEFSHRLVQFGYIESVRAYHQLLQAADMVVSTALHEFQGLAVLEAVAAGCVPVVPARLAYPEILPPQYCYASHLDDPEQEAAGAAQAVLGWVQRSAGTRSEAPAVSHFGLPSLRPRYASIFEELVAAAL